MNHKSDVLEKLNKHPNATGIIASADDITIIIKG